MKLLALFLLASCAHLPTLGEVERGLRECQRACAIGDQTMQNYDIHTGVCTCADDAPQLPARM